MFQEKTLNYIFFVSLAVVIILPLITIRFIYPLFTKILVENTEDEAVLKARHLSSLHTLKVIEWNKESLPNEFISDIEQVTRDYNIEKINVFSSSGEVIYSTDLGSIGKMNTNRYFHEIVAKGNIYTQVVQKEGKTLEGRVVSADVVETYVPLMSSGKFLGAFEIYYDITRRNQELNTVILYASIIPFGIMFAFLAVIVGVLFVLDRNITDRKRAEDSQRQRNRELTTLNQMRDLFQACHNEEETYSVVMNVCKELFPSDAGCLYMLDDSRTLLNMVASWNSPPSGMQTIGIDDCWAFRHGRAHFIEHTESGPLCSHLRFSPDNNTTYLCAPISAADQTLGVLHVCFDHCKRKSIITSKQMIVTGVTEHYALFLVNLRLRETLRMEAIRDPLTRLYNRRYMEESLEREVHHAQRHNTSVGVIMLDIDHFKTFNDTYGHQAGDIVLQELGALLRKYTRAEDIVCRYGGEELLLILPAAPLRVVKQRAEELHAIMKDLLRIEYQGKMLTISVSMGVAAFPNHGPGVKDVVNAVDVALYQAKERGRDQVVVASL